MDEDTIVIFSSDHGYVFSLPFLPCPRSLLQLCDLWWSGRAEKRSCNAEPTEKCEC